MSAILGIFTRNGSPPGEPQVRRMVERMRAPGADRIEVWREGNAAIAVARAAWQMHPALAGSLVAHDGDLVVAADATLFYRDDLRRRLAAAGVESSGDSVGHLIAAAYRAWGADCADRLEGDFAFLVWNARTRTLFCSRDFGGKRELFHAHLGTSLVVASSVGAILAHPRCPGDWELAAIAESAAGFSAASHQTCYRAVQRLQAGWSLEWSGGAPRKTRHWNPEPREPRSAPSIREAAEELRALLSDAIEQRLAPDGPTSLQLSGGWDSTAIFGIGNALLRERGQEDRLRPVSISYPPGDPGREDETIRAVTERWNTPVHWLDIADIPLFDEPYERAARRDEPFTHVYEMWNRALVRASREIGARVMFDGFGGDSLFQCSPVFSADLLRRGRWLALASEWRAKEMRGARAFYTWGVQPLLPAPLLRLAEVVRAGRPLHSYLDRRLPSWIEPDFARRHQLIERERAHTPDYPGGTRSDAELYWYLTYPFITRILGSNYRYGLDAGVEMRSPLYDRRVVEFAIRRPRTDRSQGKETKRLLRQAGRGLLPDEVLDPRPFRTGVTSGYFIKQMRVHFAPIFEQYFYTPVLADLGIINQDRFRRAVNDFFRTGDVSLGVNIVMTAHAEVWTRSHRADAASSFEAPAYESTAAVA